MSQMWSALKKKKKKSSWNGNVEMWLEKLEDVKVIQVQKLPWNTYGFFYQKKIINKIMLHKP